MASNALQRETISEVERLASKLTNKAQRGLSKADFDREVDEECARFQAKVSAQIDEFKEEIKAKYGGSSPDLQPVMESVSLTFRKIFDSVKSFLQQIWKWVKEAVDVA
ncbi:hypothetical protein BaRGS_00035165, partial [Batillaria attramentaria]